MQSLELLLIALQAGIPSYMDVVAIAGGSNALGVTVWGVIAALTGKATRNSNAEVKEVLNQHRQDLQLYRIDLQKTNDTLLDTAKIAHEALIKAGSMSDRDELVKDQIDGLHKDIECIKDTFVRKEICDVKMDHKPWPKSEQ